MKTHTTAVVLIPPHDVWGPIQRIRGEYDRHVQRWMPHITLLYPFRPQHAFDEAAAVCRAACAGRECFRVTLSRFRRFRHGARSFTLWLEPRPTGPFTDLHALPCQRLPDCNDSGSLRGGFTPHLSVGQARSRGEVREFAATVGADWQPLSFTAREICLIARGAPPEDVFEVKRRIPLGGNE